MLILDVVYSIGLIWSPKAVTTVPTKTKQSISYSDMYTLFEPSQM